MRAKGMIRLEAIESSRLQNAAAGAILAAEISAFLPAEWPNHRYSEETPDGVFEESTKEVDAPGHPGDTMIVPDWRPIGDPIGFDEAEGTKVGLFQAWLFSRRSLEFCLAHTSVPSGEVFVPFGARFDNNFEGGKFPRDQWKAGSFDVDLWNAARIAVANNLLQIILEFDRINGENIILTTRDWIIEKIVEGVTVGSMEPDATYAAVPELMEDIDGYEDEPAYQRIGQLIGPSDPSWTASKFSFAVASGYYVGLLNAMSKGGHASDYFDTCFTLWRTGSQTNRRDQYE